MAAWEQAFRRHGLQVAQVLLTGGDLADRRRFINAQNTLATLLEYRVVPVINENDTVAVDELRVGDNDTLSATVAVLVGADLLVILSDIDGLYTGDPRHDPKSELVPTVRGVDAALIESAGGTSSTVGTGGMRTKLVAARRVNDYGIPMAIASGQDAGNIGRLLAGETLGTVFSRGAAARRQEALDPAHPRAGRRHPRRRGRGEGAAARRQEPAARRRDRHARRVRGRRPGAHRRRRRPGGRPRADAVQRRRDRGHQGADDRAGALPGLPP